MSSETKFTCDICGKKIWEPFGPLRLTAAAPNLTIRIEEVDVCGIECATKWVREYLAAKLN